MFWVWFIAGLLILALFPAAEPPVYFELHCSFIRPHNVSKIIMKIFSSPPEALLFVLLSNQLAVGCPTRCPAKQLSFNTVRRDIQYPNSDRINKASSFTVVSSSLCILCSISSSTVSVSLIGQPFLGRGLVVLFLR